MHAIVAAGGDPLDASWLPARFDADLVVAADSGLAHVFALGLTPDIVVGDLDSVMPADLERARDLGARIERYPADKDATDLELALDLVRGLGATTVTVVGAGGGRLDHLVGGLHLLAAPAWSVMRITALAGPARVTVVHDRAELTGTIGSIVTLLAVGGSAAGVTTDGLRWTHADDELDATSTRGVSNEVTRTPFTVQVHTGTLLVIQPTGGR